MTTVTDPSPAAWPETSQDHPFGDPPCWADPLTTAERRELARLLASWCKSFYAAADARLICHRTVTAGEAKQLSYDLIAASVDCADLRTDVTERAAVPAVVRYDITFARVGRRHDVPPMQVCAEDAHELAGKVYRYVWRFLGSRDVDVAVNLEEMKGAVIAGTRDAGSFTIAVAA